MTRWDLVYKWSDPDTRTLVEAVTSALENCDRKLTEAWEAAPDPEGLPSVLDVTAFWEELAENQAFYTKPELVYDDPIWRMTAKEGYLFDDSFWEVFHEFPFRICHVSYSGAPWSHEKQESEPDVMVLRFTLRGKEYAHATG